MHRDARRAAAGLAAVFFGCNVYDPSMLTGPESGGASGSFTGGRGGATGGGSTGGASGSGESGSGSGGKGGSGKGGSSGSASGGAGTGGGTSGGNGATGGSSTSGDGGDAGGGGMADAGEPGTGGTAGGGTSGAGGSAGSGGAGTGGAGTGGGGTGGGGTGGTAGSGGAGTGGTAGSGGGGLDDCATGCVRLAMDAFETVDEKAHYVISFSAATDLTGRTIAYKVYKEAGGNGEFRGYIQQGGPNFQFSVIGGVALSTLTAGWQTVTLSVANEMGDANPASILRIGIEVIGVGGAPWAPAVIYVDSVTVTAAVTGSPWNFDMASSVAAPGNTDRANQIWLNNGASDTTVSGAALDWFTP